MTDKQGTTLISLLSMLISIILVQAGVRALSEQTWEYKIVGFKDASLTTDLSTVGDQGWEIW